MSTLAKMSHCWKSHVAAHMTLVVGGTLITNTPTTTNIFRISGLCTQVIRHKLCQYFDIVVYAQSRQMLNEQFTHVR